MTKHIISNAERKRMGFQLANLRQRCDNPKRDSYKHYGGRGISYDPALVTVDGILAHIGPRPSPKHSIDRIDNDRGYVFGNIRWATAKEQMRNTRDSLNITIGDQTKCVRDWAPIVGLSEQTIYTRLQQGIGPHAALYMPSKRGKPMSPLPKIDPGALAIAKLYA